MLLILHIFVALLSIVITTFLYFRPSLGILRGVYGLVAATLATGTLLVVSTNSHILSACISGLLYLSVVSVGIALVKYKLAKQSSKID